jgi:hypothetical protein
MGTEGPATATELIPTDRPNPIAHPAPPRSRPAPARRPTAWCRSGRGRSGRRRSRSVFICVHPWFKTPTARPARLRRARPPGPLPAGQRECPRRPIVPTVSVHSPVRRFGMSAEIGIGGSAPTTASRRGAIETGPLRRGLRGGRSKSVPATSNICSVVCHRLTMIGNRGHARQLRRFWISACY